MGLIHGTVQLSNPTRPELQGLKIGGGSLGAQKAIGLMFRPL
jgi:hypothetical protein